MTSERARVLVVEDEETLRHWVARGLAKMPGVEVSEAGTLAEALADIDRAAPDVILSDLDLPDRPGIELIGELGRRGLTPALTFVSAYARAFAAQIPRFAKVRVLEKPVSLEKLRETVRTDLDARGHASVDSAPFGVPDYLQIACLGRHSVVIAVAGGGRIVVSHGEVWTAEDDQGEGEAAFARLALANGARVTCRAYRDEPGARTLQRSWEALLLDAVRMADEGARDELVHGSLDGGPEDDIPLARLGAGASVSEVPLPQAADEDALFEEAKDRGMSALLRKDHAAALAALTEADRLKPGDRTLTANLVRLRELLGVKESP